MLKSHIKDWLALSFIPGLGKRTYLKLLKEFGHPRAVLEAKEEALKRASLGEGLIRAIKGYDWHKEVERELERISNLNIRFITYHDKNYPSLLKEIHDPPPFLYVKGDVEILNRPMIAIVGSRLASVYGLKIATNLALELSGLGIIVVSGLARGIDTAAHQGAIRAGGKTIAVLGCGIDIVYPRENKRLYEKIPEAGALISEFHLGTPPEAKNFPVRNRIISGLSLGVIIVEAAKRSGSLITARLALEQGREVFAVPGQIDSFRSEGTHKLIKQGAKLVEKVEDVLEEIGQFQDLYKKKEETIQLNPGEEEIFLLLDTPKYLDELAQQLKRPIGEVSSRLMTMEIRGLVRQLPGKQYVKRF